MLAEWREPRALTIHVPSEGRSTDNVVFVPGFNEVEDDVWKALEKHKGVIPFLNDRKLVPKVPSKDNKKSGKGLLRFDIREAEEIVERTYGKKVLESWKATDNRGAVIQFIDKQIERVDNAVELRPEDDYSEPKYGE